MKWSPFVSATLAIALVVLQAGSTDAVVSQTHTDDAAKTCPAIVSAPLPPRRFTFPRDNGPHDGFATEWWRTFGRVANLAGDAYDISIDISRFAVVGCGAQPNRNAWAAMHILTSAYEILDERTGHVERGMRVEREGPLGGTSARGRLDLAIAGLHLEERAPSGRARAFFHVGLRAGARATIDVDETPERKPVPLGPRGVVQTGSCTACDAYAYAYTKNAAHGSVSRENGSDPIAGTMWMEHEFSNREIDASDEGWDRFDVAFDDGREFDARFTRDRATHGIIAASGTLVRPDGRITYLAAPQITEANFPPNTRWKSQATNVSYPDSWLLDGLETSAVAQDQEIFAAERTPLYLGAVSIEDPAASTGGGHGFVELTGYANRMSL